MHRGLVIALLFLATVALVGAVLVFRIGPSRILNSGAPCPAPAARDYSRPFLVEQEIPDLCAATAMAPKDAVAFLLRRSIPVRTAIANELKTDCAQTDPALCSAKLGDAALDKAIDTELDARLPPLVKDEHGFTAVVLPAAQPYFWKEFIALRDDARPDATLNLALSAGSGFTRERVEQQYGPSKTPMADSEGYLVLVYPFSGPGYTATLRVQMDPYTNEARSFMISVRR